MNNRLVQKARRAVSLGRNALLRPWQSLQWQRQWPFVKRKLRLLVVREEAMGDVLLTTPIVRAIRRRHPDAHLTFATSWRGEEVLAGNPDIDEIVVNRTRLTGRRFDRTFELWYEYDPEMHILDAYAKSAGVILTDKQPILTLDRGHRAWAERVFQENGLREDDLIIGVHTQATWKNRIWPLANFRATLEHFAARYNARIIEFGTDPDNAVGLDVNLINQGDIKQTAAVLERCSLLLCVDSLLLHVAGAVGTPAVAIFGPVLPHTRLPLDGLSVGVGLTGLPCFGCHHRSPIPAFRTDCAQPRILCMEDLPPRMVIEAVETLAAQTHKPSLTVVGG